MDSHGNNPFRYVRIIRIPFQKKKDIKEVKHRKDIMSDNIKNHQDM